MENHLHFTAAIKFIFSTLKLQRLPDDRISTSTILSFIIVNLWVSLDMCFLVWICISDTVLYHPSLKIDRRGYLDGNVKWLATTYAYLIKILVGTMRGRLKPPMLATHELSELARQIKGWQENLPVRSIDYFSIP